MNRRLFLLSIAVPVAFYVGHFVTMLTVRPERPHWYLSEFGPHEVGAGALFMLAGLIAGGLLLRRWRELPIKGRRLIGLFAVAMILIGLEEFSYGQHFFQWQSPEFFAKNNVQHETNLHNLYGQGSQRFLRAATEFALPVIALILPVVFIHASDDAYHPGHWPRYLIPRWELATPAVMSISTRLLERRDPIILEPKSMDEFQEFVWSWAALMLALVLADRIRHRRLVPAHTTPDERSANDPAGQAIA